MFTGNPQQNLVREAQARAEAKEPPLTFVGKRGSTMPREVALHVDTLVAVDDATLIEWLTAALDLIDPSQPEAKAPELAATDRPLFTCFVLILKAAVAQLVPGSQLRGDLEALRFRPEIIERVADAVHHASRQKKSVTNGLEDFRWRVDMVSVSGGGFAPIIRLKLRLKDGTVKEMECTRQGLDSLRYHVAKCLAEMGEVERHPMMQIIGMIEAEKLKKT